VPAGDAPRLPAGQALVSLVPDRLVLSALKPADDGDGVVLRVLNPTDAPVEAEVELGFPVAGARLVRLDEEPAGDGALVHEGARLRVTVEPHRLLSVGLT
jgi:alpha-mannosidase